GAAGVDGLGAADHAVRRLHAHAADAVLAEVLLDLRDHVDGHAAAVAGVVDPNRVIDRGHAVVELDVHHWPDHLHYPSYVLGCHLLSPALLSASFAFAHPVLPLSSGEGQDGSAWADYSLTPHPIPPHVGGGDRCVSSWPRFCTRRPTAPRPLRPLRLSALSAVKRTVPP